MLCVQKVQVKLFFQVLEEEARQLHTAVKHGCGCCTPTFCKNSLNKTLRRGSLSRALHQGLGLQTHLQDVNVGSAVRAVAAAVDLDVFQPLDVRLGVAVDLTVELHVAAHLHRLIGRQACLEDGPVRGTL